MKKITLYSILISLIFLSNIYAKYDPAAKNNKKEKFKKNEILIKFKSENSQINLNNIKSLKTKIKNFKVKKQKKLFNPNKKRKNNNKYSKALNKWVKITLDQDIDIEEAIEELSKIPEIEVAEPNYIIYADAIPNDPLFTYQWALHNIGQLYPKNSSLSASGTSNSDVNAPETWDIITGNTSIVIAVIDTGVNITHPDLAANIWRNPGDDNNNNIDDDGNGFIDDKIGWDFAYGDNDPSDIDGHGTHCAGIIGARGNNGFGITGVNWQCKIMAVKGLDDTGSGYSSDLAQCIIYAADNGARVLNNSWGSGRKNQLILDAIDYAYYAKNCIIVAAAGNEGNTSLHYPAAFEPVISVIATDSRDNKASFSTYGSWCDVSAPGVDILSLKASGTGYAQKTFQTYYLIMSGTSMACPMVVGTAGLILSKYPHLSNEMVESMIIDGCDDLGAPGFDEVFANGRINLTKIFNNTSKGPVSINSHIIDDSEGASPDNVINPGEKIKMKFNLINLGGLPISNVSAILSNVDPYVTMISNEKDFGDIDGFNINSNSGNFVFQVSNTCPVGYVLNFTLKIQDSELSTWSNSFTITVGVYGPDLNFHSYSINDSTSIKPINLPDNKINPGEEVSLSIIITNGGDQKAEYVSAKISSSDPYLTVTGNSGSYSSIDIGSIGFPYSYNYSIEMRPDTPDNYNADIKLVLMDYNYTSYTDNFTVKIEHNIHYTKYNIDDDKIGESDGNCDGVINPGETIELSVYLKNMGAAANGITAVLSTTNSNIIISDNTEIYNSMGYAEEKVSSDDFCFIVKSNTPFGKNVEFKIEITDSGSKTYTNYLNLLVTYPFELTSSPILLVDNDLSDSVGGYYIDCLSFYTNALSQNNFDFDYWNSDGYGDLPLILLKKYKIVIYFTGNNMTSTISVNNQNSLASYLDNGGRLFITGQDIGFNIRNTLFYIYYLHAYYLRDDSNNNNVIGIYNDMISSGMQFQIAQGDGANNQRYPSEIEPRNPAEPIFKYDPSSELSDNDVNNFNTNFILEKRIEYDNKKNNSENAVAGLKVMTDNYRLVYLAFGFEGINNANTRSDLMQKIVTWLSYPLSSKNAEDIRIGPNPYKKYEGHKEIVFTRIPENAEIDIYTVSGTHVIKLKDDNSDGIIKWNVLNNANKEIASGIYLCRITGEEFKSIQKQIMIIK